MKTSKNEKIDHINRNAYAFLTSMLHPNAMVVDIEVIGKWLVAYIWNGIHGTSGVSFSVRNRSVDIE